MPAYAARPPQPRPLAPARAVLLIPLLYGLLLTPSQSARGQAEPDPAQRGDAPTAGAARAEAEAAAERDTRVEAIRARLDSGPGPRNRVYRAVRELANIDTPAAHDLLVELALGWQNQTHEAWAARNLVKVAPERAAELLATTDDEVRLVAVGALQGQRLDEATFDIVREQLVRSTSHHMRQAAAPAVAHEPSGRYASAAAEAIGESIATMPPNNSPVQWMLGTLADNAYFYLISQLQQIDLTDAELREVAQRLPGRGAQGIYLALARRGDTSVDLEMRAIAADPDAGIFRAWAAGALRDLGTAEDLRLLRWLAENDPLTRTEDFIEVYPVRRAASGAVAAIQERRAKDLLAIGVTLLVGLLIAVLIGLAILGIAVLRARRSAKREPRSGTAGANQT